MKIKTVFNYASLILETNLVFRRPGWGFGSLTYLLPTPYLVLPTS